MGDIYDYIQDCEIEAEWRASTPDRYKNELRDLREQVRKLENRVKYWKRKAKNNETK